MKVDDQQVVSLTISRSSEDWWQVSIPDLADAEFASTGAPTLELALRGAIAYIACVVEDVSDPMRRLFDRAREAKTDV